METTAQASSVRVQGNSAGTVGGGLCVNSSKLTLTNRCFTSLFQLLKNMRHSVERCRL